MENGEQPINPCVINYNMRKEFLGLTKREHFASKYADISNDFIKGNTAGEIKSFLGLDGAVTYDPFVHYPQAVVKLQLMFADELLKQLDHEGE